LALNGVIAAMKKRKKRRRELADEEKFKNSEN
jgi:hypothetical protein